MRRAHSAVIAFLAFGPPWPASGTGPPCGIGPRELTHLGGDAPALKPEELRQIGIRSVDPGEKKLVHEFKLDIYDMRRRLAEKGLRYV